MKDQEKDKQNQDNILGENQEKIGSDNIEIAETKHKNKIKNVFQKWTRPTEKSEVKIIAQETTVPPEEKNEFATVLFRFCYFVGASMVLVLNRGLRRIHGLVIGIQRLYKRLSKKFKRKYAYYKHVFSVSRVHHKEQLKSELHQVISSVKRKKRKKENMRFSSKVQVYFKEIRSSKELSKRIMNFGLPTVCLGLLVTVLLIANTFTVALRVTVRGNEVGYIENESVFEVADKSLQKRLVYTEGDELIRNTPIFSIALVSANQLNTSDQVCDNIISTSDASFSKATGLYVDGRLLGATTEGDKLKAFLKQTLDTNATGDPDDEISFQKNIETVDGLFMADTIKPYDEIYNTISGNEIEQKTYVIEKGDTPISIAKKHGMTSSQLYDMNPSYDRNKPVIKVGQTMVVQQQQRYLAVQVTKTIAYAEEIDFATQEIKSFNYYVGTRKVSTYGQKGSADVVAKIVYIDGQEVSKTVVQRNVTKEPVDQVIQVGSKVQTSAGTIDIGSVNATGSYVWPVQGAKNYVSAEIYGYRGHTGMDIAAPYGTAIVAVDSGVVTVSSRLYLNGLYIVINHGNGIETMYCHCSQLLVSAGQSVSKGQLIARVGSTGNATGNHLHIEFRRNGVIQNPRSYLGW